MAPSPTPHQAYVDGLGRDFDPEGLIHGFTAQQGVLFGVANAVLLEQLSLAGM